MLELQNFNKTFKASKAVMPVSHSSASSHIYYIPDK